MEDDAFFTLGPDETWHGFDGPAADLCLLDPCKILLTTGTFSESRKHSIPAPLLSAYLESKGITPESPTSILFSFWQNREIQKRNTSTSCTGSSSLKKPISRIAP